jgi:hypothetical protein
MACLAGDVATGGGYSAHHSIEVNESRPVPSGSNQTPTGWRATFYNAANGSNPGIRVYVVCADLPDTTP